MVVSAGIVLVVGNTLAANITLNSGGNVEFGQGVALTTACDDDLLVTPYSTFVNEQGGGDFMFTSLSVARISPECDGKTFIIKAYSEGSNDPLELYSTTGDGTYDELQVYDDGGDFQLVDAGLLGDDIESSGPDGNGEYSFTVNLFTNDTPQSEALASSRDVDRITIESRDGVAPSPSPSPTESPDSSYSFDIATFGGTGYNFPYIGQTFQVPSGKNGQITVIRNLFYYSCLLSNNISATLNIYDSPSKNVGYGTASLTLIKTSEGSCGATEIPAINLSSPITATAGSTFYLELYAPNNNGSFLMASSDAYAGGQLYVGGDENVVPLQDLYDGAQPGDLYFTVTMSLNS